MTDRYCVIFSAVLRDPLRIAAIALLVCACGLCRPALASVVDSRKAEQTYQSGDYAEARRMFEALSEEFRNTNTDTSDYRVYREAIYLYDRLADCAFTQKDWPALKRYLDGMLVVSHSERSLSEAALSGALASGIAYATAGYLSDQLDESVRISSIIQLKRSLVLLLLDTDGGGPNGQLAIEQYQLLAAALRSVVSTADGYYAIDRRQLEEHFEEFDAIFARLDELGNVDELWDKYPPAGKNPSQDEPQQ
ncbi:MAG: hypothetical protein H7A35_04085 [Planctomycetales bacterium]|nr:hypothetical protein [bacterium]UNM09235.1 MAG: hypothetical protein H7A35_04085 [Planctomycetales bacterium]